MKQPSYAVRVKAVKQSIEFMQAMQPPPAGTSLFGNIPPRQPIDRWDVVELARFLLGMDDEVTS